MNFTKKIKWLAAVSVLAVGMPAAGMAFASPAEHINNNSPAVTRQASQSAAPAAGAVREPGTHNPADKQEHQTPVSSSAGKWQPVSSPSAHNPAHLNDGQRSAPAAPAVKASKAQTNNGANYGYHYGHNGPNDKIHGSNSNTYEHGNHGSGGHE